MTVVAGHVEAEAPVRPLALSGPKSVQAAEGRKRGKKRGVTCVIYASRHEGFQPLIT